MLVKPMRVAEEPVQEAGRAIKSPLLFDLFGNFSEERYFQLLDIQPVSGQFIEHFSSLHCKLYLPGCSESLLSLNMDDLDTDTKLNRALVKNLGLKKQSKASLSLILLWDLPNYLDANLLHTLIQYLLPHCTDDVKLHAYIHTRGQMPAEPGVYQLQSDGKIAITLKDQQTSSSPMYYQETLQKTLSPFLVQRSILLSGGMQEYLLQRRK